MITSAKTEKLPPKDKETNASLTIYYAQKGENLWDIARKYYTSLSLIQKENDVSEEIINENGATPLNLTVNRNGKVKEVHVNDNVSLPIPFYIPRTCTHTEGSRGWEGHVRDEHCHSGG